VDSDAREGLHARPFAKALVRQIVHQLFSVQETLTLAMVGVVLLCWASKTSPRDDDDDAREMPVTQHCSSVSLVAPLRHRRTRSHQLQAHALTWGSSQDSGTWTPQSTRSGRMPPAQSVFKSWSQSQSAENTISAEFAFPHVVNEPTKPCDTARPRVIRHLPPEEEPLDLVPRDAQTLDRLVFSAHAHCDLLHRLGQFCASRALVTVLHKVQKYHELPLLNVESRYGGHSILPLESNMVATATFPEYSTSDWGSTPNKFSARGSSHPKGGMGGPRQFCAVCGQRIQRLCVMCSNCGHGFHVSCLRQLFSPALPANRTCPMIGCECRCPPLNPFQ